MPTPHPRPYHAGSLFGDGPRRPLDREQRARFYFLLTAHSRSRHITPKGEKVGAALLKRLSVDGRCDPSHQTIADDAGCDERTVRRALDAMKAIGLVMWQRRIVRDGWRTSQTSNAYLLAPIAVANPPKIHARCCGGQIVRETRSISFISTSASPQDVEAARNALAARRAAIEGRLLNKGRTLAETGTPGHDRA